VGRHSSEAQWPFYRSVVTWAVPWVFVAAIAGALVWIGVSALGNQPLRTESPAALASPTPTPTPSPVASSPKPTPTPKPSHSAKPSPSPTKLDGSGVTVQILNGTGGTVGAAQRMADRLQPFGYEVVRLDNADRAFPQTTVYYGDPDAADAAKALAEHFGWVFGGARPPNLSTTVSIHVVVGADDA
jgi:LytR cell envelope-related transcriptional attenuator